MTNREDYVANTNGDDVIDDNDRVPLGKSLS